MEDINSKLWPFLEAKKVKRELMIQKKEICIFQTGYGPSGLPTYWNFWRSSENIYGY